ncbi:MAG: DUF6765 family protein [Desulfovibrio fairfieldensis]
MNKDFHYYGTYAAARLAGYSAQDALVIARSAGFVDECTLDVLRAVMEEADGHEALKGLHDDTASIIPTAHSDAAIRAGNREWSTAFLDEVLRTWPCFHYLPGNFSAHGSVLEYQGATSDLGTYSIWYYDEEAREQFKLLCLPNSPTVKGMVNILKQKRASHLHAVGLCMHVLADTWAHQYFAGIPAWFMNDVQMEDMKIQDLTPPEPKWYDDLVPLLQDNPHYNSMAFLGHALAGHQPDYACQSFSMKAQWAKKKLKRDNPSLFMSAFKQMLYALQCINSTISGDFDLNTYADLGHDSISTDKNAELIDNVLRSGKSDQSREWCNCLLFLSLRDGGINPPEVATLRRCENDWGQGSISPEDLAAFQEAAKAHLQDVKAILAGHRIFLDDIPPERVVPLRLQLALKMPASDDAAMGRKILADLLRKVWIEQGRSASVRDRMEKRLGRGSGYPFRHLSDVSHHGGKAGCSGSRPARRSGDARHTEGGPGGEAAPPSDAAGGQGTCLSVRLGAVVRFLLGAGLAYIGPEMGVRTEKISAGRLHRHRRSALRQKRPLCGSAVSGAAQGQPVADIQQERDFLEGHAGFCDCRPIHCQSGGPCR